MAMTLDRSVEVLDAMLDIRGYCNFEQCQAWATIRAHLSAQAKVVTDEDVERAEKAAMEIKHNKEMWFPMTKRRLHAALESFAARLSQGAQVSISDALNRLEDMAVAGEQLHGDDVWRFRALVDRIAPQGAQVEEIDCHAVKALDRCVDDLQSLVDTADDMGFDEMTVQSLLTAIESMQLRKRVIQNDGLVGEIVEVKFPNPLDTLDRYVDWRNGVPSAGTKLYAHPAERAAVPEMVMSALRQCRDYIAKHADDSWAWLDQVIDNASTAAPQPPEGARVLPDGMTLVPSRFVELVRAAHRATHPRAAPQLIADAIEELTAPTLAGKEGA